VRLLYASAELFSDVLLVVVVVVEAVDVTVVPGKALVLSSTGGFNATGGFCKLSILVDAVLSLVYFGLFLQLTNVKLQAAISAKVVPITQIFFINDFFSVKQYIISLSIL
jgi:hypothetical protein